SDVDNRQFRAIVDAYADMVYRIALNQTRRGADADDVVQAVFLKLYEKPPEWLGRASVPRRVWLSAMRYTMSA
ncbi:RNA polymerase sigma factor, partial [Adlercreutzia caecimuris]|uniref:RNA polymerase sigma factor n=1 Tax=Adlercreutzia caecimuris TaxID=671266 RepID=UPI00258F165D